MLAAGIGHDDLIVMAWILRGSLHQHNEKERHDRRVRQSHKNRQQGRPFHLARHQRQAVLGRPSEVFPVVRAVAHEGENVQLAVAFAAQPRGQVRVRGWTTVAINALMAAIATGPDLSDDFFSDFHKDTPSFS